MYAPVQLQLSSPHRKSPPLIAFLWNQINQWIVEDIQQLIKGRMKLFQLPHE